MSDLDLDSKVNTLINTGVITDDEWALIASINGVNETTLNDALFARTGYHTFDQWLEEMV